MRAGRGALGSAACALLLGAAQAPETPIDRGVEEKVEVHLVQMPVVATDRQGRPIADLKPEEVIVKDQGERLRVAYLERAVPSPVPDGPRPDVRLFVRAPGGLPEPATAIPGGASHLVLLVDTENDPPLRREEALDALVAFARERTAAGVRVAVLSFAGELRLETTFTDQPAIVEQALRQAAGRTPPASLELGARIRQLVDKFDDCRIAGGEFSAPVADERCLRDTGNEYAGEVRARTLRFVKGLDALVEFLAGLEGRKTALVVSHGVPVEAATVILEAARAVFGPSEQVSDLRSYLAFGEEGRIGLDRVLEKAVRNRVTLSFLDRMPVPTGDFGAARGHALQPGASPARGAYEAARADMTETAATTGGVHVAATDVAAGIARIRQAEEGSYELGYYARRHLPAKRLARVDVDTTRKGVKLVHRRGYYAQPPDAGRTLAGKITLAAPARRESGPGARYAFQIQVEPREIGYAVAGDEAVANFTLHVAVQDEGGRAIADSYHFINHAYPAEIWEAGEAGLVLIGGWVDLPAGRYRLVATLRNTQTGKTGQLERQLQVEA